MKDPKKTIEKLTKFARNPQVALHMEAMESNEYLQDIADKLEKHTEPLEKVNEFLKAVKGEKGDSPVRGVDYFTDEEIKDFKNEIQSKIRVPEDGYTPRKGIDYFLEEEIEDWLERITPIKGLHYNDGKDADEEKIISAVLSKIPIPKDGKDGISPKPLEPKVVANEAIKILTSLKGKDRPSLYVFKEGEELMGTVRLHQNMMKNMPKSLLEGDQRWHGGGGGGTYTAGTGISISGSNVISALVASLTAGTGITITPDGLGGFTIAATGVASITAGSNIAVDNTDPQNPIVSTVAEVTSIVAGNNITVDATDPHNPIVNATASGGGGSNVGIEIPTGTIDSSNTTFTAVNLPFEVIVDNQSFLVAASALNGLSVTGSGPYTITVPIAPNSWIGDLYNIAGAAATWIQNELVSGSGVNFVLLNTPVSTNSEHIYGTRLRMYPTTDFTIAGTSIVTSIAYNIGDILADYFSGTTYTGYTDNEIVSGSGTAFTLAATPIVGSERLFAQRHRLKSGTDYTISGAGITTTLSYSAGDLLCDYQTSADTACVSNENVSGSGTSWTLANTPVTGSVELYDDSGERLYPNSDYTIVGTSITTTLSFSALIADYRK